jgi:SAM-dependent methyltransferase
MAEIERLDGLPGPRQARGIEDFDALYAAGTPAWNIGRPQSAFCELADRGRLVGRVLDVGCGTGEHALMAAATGLDATGLDAAGTAIAIAKRKADERALTVQFMTWDALRLADLGQSFDTVLDCGCSTSSRTQTGQRSWRACGPACRPMLATTCCASAISNLATGALAASDRTRSGSTSSTAGWWRRSNLRGSRSRSIQEALAPGWRRSHESDRYVRHRASGRVLEICDAGQRASTFVDRPVSRRNPSARRQR